MVEIKRRLSWVEFLAPLSEGELEDLARGASLVDLERGENSSSATRSRPSGCSSR